MPDPSHEFSPQKFANSVRNGRLLYKQMSEEKLDVTEPWAKAKAKACKS